MKVKTVPIDSVYPDPANARKHGPRNLEGIRASLARFGQVRPILIDSRGVVRAGNGTLDAAKALGWDKIDVVVSDLPAVELTAYSLVDNRLPELAEWDKETLGSVLTALESDDFPVDELGWSDDELQSLFDRTPAPDPDEDDTPAPEPRWADAETLQAKWGTARGQLWTIVSPVNPTLSHRIVCGDVRDPADVALIRAMPGSIRAAFTSPPYAERRKAQYGGVPSHHYVEWFHPVQANVRNLLMPDGSFFLNIDTYIEKGFIDLYIYRLALSMVEHWGWGLVDELCWKHGSVPGAFTNRFRSGWEPVYHFALQAQIPFHPLDVGHESPYCYNGGKTDKSATGSGIGPLHDMAPGIARPSNVIETHNSMTKCDHPAAFPSDLPQFFMKAYSDPGEVWIDPFLGSGTTILAAEATGRTGFGMEIQPKYVAVALERLADAGLTPTLA